jgi:hypothetical protein
MKHKILGKKSLANSYLLLEVELIPENENEQTAIKKVELMDASESQKELVENYLLFGLNQPYSILSVEKQVNSRFILKASTN